MMQTAFKPGFKKRTRSVPSAAASEKVRQVLYPRGKMSIKNSIFNELREQQHFCDVIFRVDNREFHAHKIILCNCSPYFRALLTQWSPPDRRLFDVSDMSPQIMELIIHYAYTDTLPVTTKNVVDLCIVADRLNIMGIVQVCRDLMEQHLSPLNCIRIWRFANIYSQMELTHKAFLFLLTHFEEVIAASEEFRDLTVEELEKIMGNDRINVREEKTVYEAVLRWIHFAPEERHQHLSRLLSKVRLAQISEEYIKRCVLENPMVKNNHECQNVLLHEIKVIRELKKNPPSGALNARLPLAALLAFGGRKNSASDGATIRAYDSRVDRWVDVMSDNGAPRGFHGSVVLNGFVYCVGGSNSTQWLSSVHRFDPETQSWKEVAPMHSRRDSVTTTVLDGCIYALGGYDGHSHLASAEVYRPDTNQWTEITPMHQERNEAGCAALNGKVYVFGGDNGWQLLSSAECYDPHTNQWTMIAKMNRRRTNLGVVAYANTIYVIGGYTGHSHTKTVEAYDPDSNTWNNKPPMLKSRSDFGVSVMDGRIFVVGGFNFSGLMNAVECYDFRTSRWSKVCDYGVCRSGLRCCVVAGLSNMTNYIFPRCSPHL